MILDWLRKREGWFTKSILILLAITFIFGFGFGLVNFGAGENVPQGSAAEVNGEEIPIVEFYRARDNIYSRYRQQGGVPEGVSDFINYMALNQLIELKLLSQKARELGFRVTDEELGASIKAIPALQIDGEFIGVEAYRAFVEQSLNESVGEFEKKYREELLAQKLINFIYETAKVTDEELFNLYKMENEKVNLYFVSFSPESFTDSFSPGKGAINNYYESHKAEFKTPELRSIRYVSLTPESFENEVSVSDEEIKTYYESRPDEFKTGDGVRPLSEARDEIRKKIKAQEALLLQSEFAEGLGGILEEKSLVQIAKENEIGGVKESSLFSLSEKADEIPPQVVESAFSTEKGKKSLAQAGRELWIIQVAEVVPPKQKTLEEAEAQITERLKFERAKRAARQKAEQVLREAKAGGAGLESVASSTGLELQETGYFSRVEGVPQILSDKLKLDAFYLDGKNPVAPEVYSSGDKSYVVSLKERQEIDRGEFEEKKAEIKELALSQRRRDIYLDWVQKLRDESEVSVNQNLFPLKGKEY